MRLSRDPGTGDLVQVLTNIVFTAIPPLPLPTPPPPRVQLQKMGLHVLGDWDSPVMPIMLYHLSYLSAISRLCLARHVAMVVVGFPATALLMGRCR